MLDRALTEAGLSQVDAAARAALTRSLETALHNPGRFFAAGLAANVTGGAVGSDVSGMYQRLLQWDQNKSMAENLGETVVAGLRAVPAAIPTMGAVHLGMTGARHSWRVSDPASAPRREQTAPETHIVTAAEPPRVERTGEASLAPTEPVATPSDRRGDARVARPETEPTPRSAIELPRIESAAPARPEPREWNGMLEQTERGLSDTRRTPTPHPDPLMAEMDAEMGIERYRATPGILPGGHMHVMENGNAQVTYSGHGSDVRLTFDQSGQVIDARAQSIEEGGTRPRMLYKVDRPGHIASGITGNAIEGDIQARFTHLGPILSDSRGRVMLPDGTLVEPMKAEYPPMSTFERIDPRNEQAVAVRSALTYRTESQMLNGLGHTDETFRQEVSPDPTTGQPRRVIEIGPDGPQRLANRATRYGADYYPIEPKWADNFERGALEADPMASRHPNTRSDVAQFLSFPDNHFDVYYAHYSVPMHLQDASAWVATLAEAARVIRPGGIARFSPVSPDHARIVDQMSRILNSAGVTIEHDGQRLILRKRVVD